MQQRASKTSPFAHLMGPGTFWWLIGGIFLATLVFRTLPVIDMEAARLFYDKGFHMAHDPFFRAVRRTSINMTVILVALLILLWFFRLLNPKASQWAPFAKLGFPSLSLLLGPMIVTNLIFKEQWGRPRPKHLEQFGGESSFVLPWDMSDQCATNCSFVSGETSSAIWLLALIPLLPLAWHRRALWAVANYTVLISTLRIAFGGHFLSDVVFSILFNLMVMWWVWGLFFERAKSIEPRTWANETRASGAFTRLGKPLRYVKDKITKR